MHGARILQNKRNECVTMHEARILQKDRTSALQCTERVYYRKTERVRYNAQSAHILQKDRTSVSTQFTKERCVTGRKSDENSALLRQMM